MAFRKRREILGIYSVKNANPNGDPLKGNEPRMDEETGRVLVSDVRIKRTIRDQWDREGKCVFVKTYDSGEALSLKQRYMEPDIGGVKGDERKDAQHKMRKCIDVRLFGIVFSPKGMEKVAFSWTGPVQFTWGMSLHRVKPELIQGTAAFTSDDNKKQRSLRTEWIVPFAMISFYSVANQFASETTGAAEEDLEELRKGWWLGTKNLITRSKFEHRPLMWLEIVYRDEYKGLIGDLTSFIVLKNQNGEILSEDEGLALRDASQVIVDLSKLAEVIEKEYGRYIEKIIVVKDKTLKVEGLENIKGLIEELEPQTMEV